jgi:uncharacterized protein YndB with AHSA1/START domain
MAASLVAHATMRIAAPRARVWQALVDPAEIKRYFFGTDVETTWAVGGPIFWRGEWQGQPYEDKGTVLRVEPERLLQFTHFSPLTGQPDEPASYHTITIELSGAGAETVVTLAQDNNATEDERAHFEANWNMVLGSLKALVEGTA